MELKYIAHAAFLFTSNNGTKVLTDPYESGGFNGAIQYRAIEESVDIISTSHKTKSLGIELASSHDFIHDKENVKNFSETEVELTKDSLPTANEIWILDHSN